MKCFVRSIVVGVVSSLSLLALSCGSGPEATGHTEQAAYSVDPSTVTAGTPSSNTASCPGHLPPDQCGSWAGVELSASMSFSPPGNDADTRCLCGPIAFQIPASLPVTTGNAGFGDALFEFRKSNNRFVECLYHGNARLGRLGKVTGGDAYDLIFCSDLSSAGSAVSADWFSLTLASSAPTSSSTAVLLRLGAPDVVGGVVQEEIVYANDSRIPGAALHIPRGSVPPGQRFTFQVLPQPTSLTTIENGGDEFETTGLALDVHATGVDSFVFTNVPGASCPSIDLPYSASALQQAFGAGEEGRLRARQITDLNDIAAGGTVLAETAPVTVDTTNQLVSFCVPHLSFYVAGVKKNDDKLVAAGLIAGTAPASCTTTCPGTQVCINGGCFADVLASAPASLTPSAPYLLRLQFQNLGTTNWTNANLRMGSVTPGTASPPPALAPSPWFPALGTTPFVQTYSGAAVAQNQSAFFDVPVTAPILSKGSPGFTFGSALDLCLTQTTVTLSECFSWDYPPHLTSSQGLGFAPIKEICDDQDNDGVGGIDNGVTKPCYDGPGGTQNVGLCKGGISTCKLGVFGACAGEVTPVTETCNDVDDDCDGTTDNGVTQACYDGPAGTEGVGACHDGVQACVAGAFSGSCQGEQTPVTEVCNNGIDDDCNGRTDEGCDVDDSRLVINGDVSNDPSVYLPDANQCSEVQPGTEFCNECTGTAFHITFGMQNTGNTTWTTADGYRLTPLVRNCTVDGLDLATDVRPGDVASFNLTATCQTCGSGTINAEMSKNGAGFGDRIVQVDCAQSCP